MHRKKKRFNEPISMQTETQFEVQIGVLLF